MAERVERVERMQGANVPASGQGLVARARRFIVRDLWHVDLRPRSLQASAVRFLQLCVMIARGFVRDDLLLRASALTYVTTLSLIPLLVVTVALFGLVGGQQSLIERGVALLTAVSPQAREVILGQVQEAKLGSLGTLGASLLIVTAVLALRHLESTLNEIWGIRSNRSWMRRFSDYLAVLIVAPILTATAISLATGMQSRPVIEELLQNQLVSVVFHTGYQYLPTLLLLISFGFLYWFFPNTSVRPFSALLGAAVATVLFSMARHVYVDLSLGAARYSVLFGSMAALPLVLAWLYVCWAIVLLGAEVSFAHQNLAHYRRELQGGDLAPAEREAFGLRIAVEVARSFVHHEPPPSDESLSERLSIPIRTVRELIDCFEHAGILLRAAADEREGGYVPARPVRDVSVTDVVSALRGVPHAAAGAGEEGASGEVGPVAAEGGDEVDRVLRRLEHAMKQLGDATSLADLVGRPTTGPAHAPGVSDAEAGAPV